MCESELEMSASVLCALMEHNNADGFGAGGETDADGKAETSAWKYGWLKDRLGTY